MDPIFENNFTISAKIEIVILNDVIVIEKKVRKKSTKLKKKLTQKQQKEREYCEKMLELDEIRSMDGDSNIYN